jgi:tetratricopeptide (TPR) repeat protein
MMEKTMKTRLTIRLALLLVTFAALCLFIPVAGATDIQKAGMLATKGDRAMETAQLDKATTLYNRALKAAPEFPMAHIGLGNLAMARQDYEGALRHYEQARDGFVTLGEQLVELQAKRYADASKRIAELNDSIQQISSQSSGGGTLDISITRMQSTINQLHAITPPSNFPAEHKAPGEVYFQIGNALFRLNRIDEALIAWETCRESSPDFPMVYNNLALIYWKTGRMEEAVRSLRRAETLGFPVNPDFKRDLGKAAGAGN